MAIPTPWDEREKSSEGSENGPNGARERARDHAGARGYTDTPTDSSEGRVVRFPGSGAEVTTRNRSGLSSAVSVWASEATRSAVAAVDGSVWRARPPALRDIHARMTRGEWAGGNQPLYLAGLVFGYVSLVATALGYALLWVASRPSRTAVAVLITVLVVVLAI